MSHIGFPFWSPTSLTLLVASILKVPLPAADTVKAFCNVRPFPVVDEVGAVKALQAVKSASQVLSAPGLETVDIVER